MKTAGNSLFYMLSGILLFSAWPMSAFTFLIFIAWIPLLVIEKDTVNPYRFFFILLLNLLIWNTATTWWIWNASQGGAIGAIVVNSLLMTIPWMLFRVTRQRLGATIGYVSLVLYWITFEYLHHNWDLSWPWLTLGNAFANHPEWVKWFQYTGTTGGSLWILTVNILLYKALSVRRFGTLPFPIDSLKTYQHRHQAKFTSFILPLLVMLLPIVYSMIIKGADMTTPDHYKSNVVIVQPNVEPYEEKFTTDPFLQIKKLIQLSESKIDTNTRLVVWPETAISVQVWEDRLTTNPFYQPVYDFVKRHPHVMLVTGIDSRKNYGSVHPKRYSIRTDDLSGAYFEGFNTAMAIDSSLQIQLYHKAKLVPGVETLPSWLSFLGKIFENYGGISGTLGKSDSSTVFAFPSNAYKPAPVICYESIYSEYVASYIQKGANIITIITNDGWWDDTPGYRQHQSYARLRAIETGCWIARSANTGISCFISPSGAIFQPQPWNTASAIKMDIPTVTSQTFYVRNGDWISRIAWVLTTITLLVTVIKKWYKKRRD